MVPSTRTDPLGLTDWSFLVKKKKKKKKKQGGAPKAVEARALQPPDHSNQAAQRGRLGIPRSRRTEQEKKGVEKEARTCSCTTGKFSQGEWICEHGAPLPLQTVREAKYHPFAVAHYDPGLDVPHSQRHAESTPGPTVDERVRRQSIRIEKEVGGKLEEMMIKLEEAKKEDEIVDIDECMEEEARDALEWDMIDQDDAPELRIQQTENGKKDDAPPAGYIGSVRRFIGL